jgi:acyl dehydratase
MYAKFDEIAIGQVAEKTTVISRELIRDFGRVTGDENPVHFDEEYAYSVSIFRRCVAHGMIPVSIVCGLLGSQLPGPGTILISQNFEFKAPVYPDDSITARLEVLEKDGSSNKIKIKATVVNQWGTLVLVGHCVVMQRLPKNLAKKG